MAYKGLFYAAATIGASFGAIVLLKEFGQGQRYDGNEKLKGRTAVVTGANCGIGYEVARDFANRGARVILACRDTGRCRAARRQIVKTTRNKRVRCADLDLRSFDSIRKFVDEMAESKIDILVNNAGVMRVPKRQVTQDGIEVQMGVNHFGHFLLTNLLMERLEASRYPARIINVSSVAHTKSDIDLDDMNWERADYDAAIAYNRSKTANVMFTRELDRRIRERDGSITVNAVHPGVVNSKITRYMPFFHSWFADVFVFPLMWLFLKTPRMGAQTIVKCAVDPDLATTSGRYFSNCAEVDVAEHALNDEKARRLWMLSERWTRLYDDQSVPSESLSHAKAL